MFSSVGIKDSVKNIEETGVFTFSLATEKLFDAMNGSSVPANYEIDEFKLTNLPYVQGKFVDAPYVKDSPAAVSYTHLRAHETSQDLVCRLLLEKKNEEGYQAEDFIQR